MSTTISNLSCRFAHDIAAGDCVLIQKNDQLVPEKVINVSSIAIQGNNFVVSTFYEHSILVK